MLGTFLRMTEDGQPVMVGGVVSAVTLASPRKIVHPHSFTLPEESVASRVNTTVEGTLLKM